MVSDSYAVQMVTPLTRHQKMLSRVWFVHRNSRLVVLIHCRLYL